MTDSLVGFRPLFQVTARQDAHHIAPWVMLISALSASSAIGYPLVFPDRLAKAALSLAVGANPAFGLLFGTPRDLMTADGFNAWRVLALGGFFTALMAILTVVRNSRANEDSGQDELIASGVVGRYTRLMVAVGLASLASVAVGVVSWVATIAFGGGPANSAALSATFTASGFLFAAVAAVAAQIGSFARTASAIAITVLGGCYLIRGSADASDPDGWVVWLSPLGWTEQVHPASGNNWWPLLGCLALTVTLLMLAVTLLARRDFGMGLIPPSPGPARGGAVTSVWGLALRLHRGSIIAWTIAFGVLGIVFGNVSTTLGAVLSQNSGIAAALAGAAGGAVNLTFAFLLTLLNLLGIIAAVYGVQVGMRYYVEETELRAEPLLAGSLARSTLFASHAVIALAGPALALLWGALVIGVTASAAGAPIEIGDVVRQALVEIPAVWVLIGLCLALVGAGPAVRMASWLGVVATFALTILGPLFKLPTWMLGISPLWHVPTIGAPESGDVELLALALIAAALITVGFAGYRRRDVL